MAKKSNPVFNAAGRVSRVGRSGAGVRVAAAMVLQDYGRRRLAVAILRGLPSNLACRLRRRFFEVGNSTGRELGAK
jgi:hypothetical protein